MEHHVPDDSFIPAVLTAAIAAAGECCLRRARERNDISLLDEQPAVAFLSDPANQRELAAAMNHAAARRHAELPTRRGPCPILVLGFLPPRRLSGSVSLDDTAVRYHDTRTGRTELWFVNLKHERKDSDGNRRLAASKSFWNAACGLKAPEVDQIGRTVIDQIDAGCLLSCGILAFAHGPAGFAAGDTDVLAYDPVAVFACYHGELTPVWGLDGHVELVDQLDHEQAGTFSLFPRSSWLVQADHRRAVRIWDQLAPALVADGTDTRDLARLALHRWSATLDRRIAEDAARAATNSADIARALDGWTMPTPANRRP